MTVSDDGNRGYMASGDGLIIVDLTEIQQRKPNPQIPEISRLTWSTMTIPQVAHPVTIDGKPYIVEVDEYSIDGKEAPPPRQGPVVGPRGSSTSPTRPSRRSSPNIRLEVHQPENRAAIAGDYGAQNPTQGYAAHYCNVPRREDPGIMACSMILSGLRVFDIRDPREPQGDRLLRRPAGHDLARPAARSSTSAPTGRCPSPTFVPERGEIWYSDGTSGFYALKVDPDVWPFPSSSVDVKVRSPRLASDSRRGRNIRLRVVDKTGLPAISHFLLQYRRTGRGTKKTYRTLRPRLAKGATSVKFKGKAGETYLFRIAAIGTGGERSNFRYSRTAFPYDDRGKGRQYSRGWRKVKNSRAWLGGYTQSSRSGATLNFSVPGGGRIYLVARTGPNGGTALLGRGSKKQVVSFRSKTRRNRRVVAIVNRTDKRIYRLRLKVLSGTVTFDGLGVRRR